MKKCNLTVAICMSAALLGGCKEDDANAKSTAASAAVYTESTAEIRCKTCGSVVAIEPVTAKGGGSGAGVVLGAIVGGLLGNQVGGGSGKDVATVVGAVGGAVAGNEIEKQSKSQIHYDVTVDLDSGGTRVVSVASAELISIGTHVKVVDNNLEVL